MVNPVPSHPGVDTPYGQQGDLWGCGWHDGIDLIAPEGVDVVAMWDGTVIEVGYPTSFGSAFGRSIVIDHDTLPDGTPGYFGLYAHLSAEYVYVGQPVVVGQWIGDVGNTGNSTGPHLHTGIYKQPSWCSGCGINPQRWVDAQLPPQPSPQKPRKDPDMILIEHADDGRVCLCGVSGAAWIAHGDTWEEIKKALVDPSHTAIVDAVTFDNLMAAR